MENFIQTFDKEEFGYDCFNPKEIELENENINSSIIDKAYKDFLPNKENYEYETVGKFLYSIGGISRVSQRIANKIYIDLYEEYKKYLESNRIWLTFNLENDRRNLSIWTKNCLKDNHVYEYYSYLNITEIRKYLYNNEEETNKFLFIIFQSLIGLYLKCRLSFPIIEAKYINNNSDFDPKIMIDNFLKSAKKKKVNFCYLPGLISNGRYLKNGKILVFSYIKGQTFQIEGNVYENQEENQFPKLYTLPNFNNFKFIFSNMELKITNPVICSDLNPTFYLNKYNNYSHTHSYDSNNTGIFKIKENELQYTFSFKVTYADNLSYENKWFKIG